MKPLDFSDYQAMSQPEQEAARQALADSLISAYANMDTADRDDAFARAGIVPSPKAE
jgi:hypothetical protein